MRIPSELVTIWGVVTAGSPEGSGIYKCVKNNVNSVSVIYIHTGVKRENFKRILVFNLCYVGMVL